MGLPQTSSGLVHPVPSLSQLNLRIDHASKRCHRIQRFYPQFIIRIEYLILILLADLDQFDEDEGSLSIRYNVVPDLRRKLESASPFCKHYMHHLDPENLNSATWRHALYKPPVEQPKMSDEDDRHADWETIAQSMYYESRFETNPNLPAITEPKAEEISKAHSRDKGKCVVTGCPDVKHFWLIPFTWNNTPPHNDSTGNLEGASMDLADVDMLDGELLNARELGMTHKSWNIMCIDRVLCDFLQRGWGGFRFEDAGQPNEKGIVKVTLRFYWMPQMTGRFNRETTDNNELMDLVNEFNAFVRAGCPPPPTYPKSEGVKIPESGQLVVVERDEGDLEKFTGAVKMHWVCVVYTALCGGAGRPQFMTGIDQSYGHLQPRDEQFAQQKDQLEEKDLVAQMAWKGYYQPSSDSGSGGSDPRTSGDGGGRSSA
ncbi:hypothetical protein NW768_002838 [Fusarium equiseti]|uniref:HNH nuclease domain-containing protein n=1 Tax=Fusarium equiseti TaxID=61235 RepID=A0ABQ8RKB6_FUSEQ|nr:hypothetical protein NW768_002838 [Fusarium equiseti]